MFSILTVAILLLFVYWRPHEIFETMRPLTVQVVTLLVLFGLALDVQVGAIRRRGTPLLLPIVALAGWFVITVVIKAPDQLGEQLALLGISVIAFFAISQGLQSLRALEVTAALLLAFTIALAALGVYQGTTPTVCFVLGGETTPMGVADVPDGRSCDAPADCRAGGLPDHEYACEHPGLLGTHSYGKRVRFRGLLEDPNELAWAIAMGTPLAFALYGRRRSLFRLIVLLATVGLGVTATIMAESRSGQIAMVAVLVVYFVRRFGWRGAVGAAVAALPLLILGGRSGEGAESSSEERMGCWAAGLQMWRENPLLGVGGGQFMEHHFQTAHNSFVLALAELGPAGLLLWSGTIYAAFKIVLCAQRELDGRPEAAAASAWATALLASLVGMVVSAFFLTLAFHTILWIFLGLTGALYAAVRAHDPTFQVRFDWRDFAFVSAGDGVLVVALHVYLRLQGIT